MARSPASEELVATAQRVVGALDNSVFAIQGPPGSGKTYTAAHMICDLVAAGKKVGVTALGHKVIRKVLEEVRHAANGLGMSVPCVQKVKDGKETEEQAREPRDHHEKRDPVGAAAVRSGER